MSRLSHLDARGRVRMVDVTDKPVTARLAVAEGRVRLSPATLRTLRAGTAAKGDVLTTAHLAGVQAAKRTSELIPLAHPLALDAVSLEFRLVARPAAVAIVARVRTSGRTGVEMEALTAVSVAALTLYDMLKAIDRGMSIEHIRLREKRGGRTGAWTRPRSRSPR
jgi:cyclic pyranopterin phosphate synthase